MERSTISPSSLSAPYGVQATKGHLAGNGGLRGHSVGDKFPVIIGLQGKPNNLKWFAQAPDGAEMSFNAFELASEAADAWLTMRCLFDTPQDRVGLTYSIRKVKSNEDEEGNTNCEDFYLNETVDFDFFGLYASNGNGWELIADNSEESTIFSASSLGRIAAFLAKAKIKEEYASFQADSRQFWRDPLTLTLDEFFECKRRSTTNLSDAKLLEYYAFDSRLACYFGKELWDILTVHYY